MRSSLRTEPLYESGVDVVVRELWMIHRRRYSIGALSDRNLIAMCTDVYEEDIEPSHVNLYLTDIVTVDGCAAGDYLLLIGVRPK